MKRLNVFRHFESKKEHHEDALTRAFLIVLRAVPEAHRSFLQLVASSPHAPSGLPHLNGCDGVDFATQTSRVEQNAERLLSVLLTDEHLDRSVSVSPAERGARYDGVIAYPPGWVFVIENKPSSKHVWDGQLSPSIDSCATITHIEQTPVVLRWRDLISAIRGVTKGQLQHAERIVVDDFLSYVHENFPFLNPFATLGECRDNLGLLELRCAALLDSFAPGCIQRHIGWHEGVLLLDGPACRMAALYPFEVNGSWELRLALHPGDTVNQARALYKSLNVKRLKALPNDRWRVEPNLHFAFMQGNECWADKTVPVDPYIQWWLVHPDQIRQHSIRDAAFTHLLNTWRGASLVNDDDLAAIESKFMRSKRSTINVCPGLTLYKGWAHNEAVDIDTTDALQKEVMDALKAGLECWDQPMIFRKVSE